MAIGGILGNGARVGYSITSPLALVRIAQLMNVPKELEFIAADIDTTVHSTSRISTSMPGMFPVPETELDLLLDSDPSTTASHESMRLYQLSGVTLFWRIEFPVDRLQSQCRPIEFQAYIKSWQPSRGDIAKAQTAKALLRFGGGYWVPPVGAFTIV